MVKDEAGRRLVFRFYDPRVLRVYLPTCRPAETDEFFGPVHEMLMESEDARDILVFEHRPQGLSQREIPV
jgi:hypothetical protein